MPKRRRLFTPLKNRSKPTYHRDSNDAKEVSTARGRLKGALMDVLDPACGESDPSSDNSPEKQESQEQRLEDEDKNRRKWSLLHQSYVLKLFDRSVDLSQFSEDSPLYPICRAWIANQPRANYSEFGQTEKEPEVIVGGVLLPGPEGERVTKIPPLLPIQLEANKDNINLNYCEAPPPSREELLASHTMRWLAVRRAWLDQAIKVEARYEISQQILDRINVKNKKNLQVSPGQQSNVQEVNGQELPRFSVQSHS